MLPLIDERADRFDGLLEDVGRVQKLFFQANLAARDPRDVEQVVNQADELPHLSLDDVLGEVDILGVVGHLEDGDGIADGGEGIAQLVGEHRQKLVLSSIVVAQLFVKPAVLDGTGGHLRELHEERLVLGGELALDLVQKLDEADTPAVLAEEGRSEPAVGGLVLGELAPLRMLFELGLFNRRGR